MDIRQINYFVQVADCGNYSLASQKLFVSQPALSKTIKNMEEELGFVFFYTFQRKQHLTDAGKAFYDKAVELLKEYNELMEMAYDEAGVDKGSVEIGLSTSTGSALFSRIYPKFKAKYPLIDINIMESDGNSLIEAVNRKDIDAAIIDTTEMSSEEKENFEVTDLMTSEVVLVTYAGNPLASRECLEAEDVDNIDLLLYNRSPEDIMNYIKKTRIKPNIKFSSSHWFLLFELVASEYGSVLAPRYIYDLLKNDKITALPINYGFCSRSISLISRKDDNRSRACRIFVDFLSDKSNYQDVSIK